MASFASSDGNASFYEFSAGVTATLRRWTALRAAVEGDWGGANSKNIADNMRTSIIQQLTTTSCPPDVSSIEDYLYITMEEEFCCQLEDGSPKDVANILHEMAVKCRVQDYTLARTMVTYAEKEREQLENKINAKIITEGDDDDDDMDDMDDGMDCGDDMDEGGGGAPTTTTTSTSTSTSTSTIALQYSSTSVFGSAPPPAASALPPPRQLGEAEPEKPKVEVDEDGFAPVVRRSKRKNKGKMNGAA